MQKIVLFGHSGMVGRAILRRLQTNQTEDQPLQILTPSHGDLDLRDQAAVREYMAQTQPESVILAAARVGGIVANNDFPAQFIHDNLMIAANVIDGAHRAGVQRLLNLGSSCIYPRDAAQPISEDALLTGTLEPTNEPYAIAKIAALKLCESYNRQYGTDYRSVMPTNLYGIGDNFHPSGSHVLPALIRRFHEAAQTGAEEVVVWGSGTPLREFLFADDMAEGALFVMNLPRDVYQRETQPMLSHINLGSGQEISIRDLAKLVAKVTGFEGSIRFDTSKPDGTPRKLMDISRLSRLGWHASTPLEEGIAKTYAWFLAQSSKDLRL